MILVIGSTGLLGSEVCRQLAAKKLKVRAMVRKTTDQTKRDELKNLGAELAEGDIRDKSTFPEMLKGISTVISTVSSMPFAYLPGDNDITKVDEEGMINLIDAAINAGIKHFIYTSFSRNISLDFPLCNAKRKVEFHLQQSGLTYTILRPAYFMEVWFTPAVGFDAAGGNVNLCGNGTNAVAYISLKDVAKFATECITNPHALNAVLELGGHQNLPPLEAVKIFEEALGRKIDVQPIPSEALQDQLSTATDPMQKSFAGLMCSMANGDCIDMANTLKNFPVKLSSVKEYINQAMLIK